MLTIRETRGSNLLKDDLRLTDAGVRRRGRTQRTEPVAPTQRGPRQDVSGVAPLPEHIPRARPRPSGRWLPSAAVAGTSWAQSSRTRRALGDDRPTPGRSEATTRTPRQRVTSSKSSPSIRAEFVAQKTIQGAPSGLRTRRPRSVAPDAPRSISSPTRVAERVQTVVIACMDVDRSGLAGAGPARSTHAGREPRTGRETNLLW